MPVLKMPKTRAEFEAMLKAAEDTGFNSGTIAALAVVYSHDQPVIWAEIVRAGGTTELLRHAKNKKNLGDWAWAGFKKYARDELGADVVAKALAPVRPLNEFGDLWPEGEARRPGIVKACKKLRAEHPSWSKDRIVCAAKVLLTGARYVQPTNGKAKNWRTKVSSGI